MSRAGLVELRARIVIDNPVVGVLHSLQSKEGGSLDPKRSAKGEPLSFDFSMRVGPGPKLFGDQIRREGPERRFVYIRVGQFAGDLSSPWSRRMKIDVHDTPQDLIAQAIDGGVLQMIVNGTGKDGSPACATVRLVARSIA